MLARVGRAINVHKSRTNSICMCAMGRIRNTLVQTCLCVCQIAEGELNSSGKHAKLKASAGNTLGTC